RISDFRICNNTLNVVNLYIPASVILPYFNTAVNRILLIPDLKFPPLPDRNIHIYQRLKGGCRPAKLRPELTQIHKLYVIISADLSVSTGFNSNIPQRVVY